LDGLYANIPVIEICNKNGWKYLITFKPGSMPEVFREYESLRDHVFKDNYREYNEGKVRQVFRWAEDVLHYKEAEQSCGIVNVLECVETVTRNKKTKTTNFVWLTNFGIDVLNERHQEIAGGGRLRWKIENEGFNVQKNGDYDLEHAYCKDSIAIKNFYYLLQIAHIISQLMEKGSLLVKEIKKVYGSIKNFSRKLLESLRWELLSLQELQNELSKPFQIRLDTS